MRDTGIERACDSGSGRESLEKSGRDINAHGVNHALCHKYEICTTMHDMARVHTTTYQNVPVHTNTCHYAHAILVHIGTYLYILHILYVLVHIVLGMYWYIVVHIEYCVHSGTYNRKDQFTQYVPICVDIIIRTKYVLTTMYHYERVHTTTYQI